MRLRVNFRIALLTAFFLSVLNRPPRSEESKRFVAYLRAEPKSEKRIEEAIWVLLNCSEFRFNH